MTTDEYGKIMLSLGRIEAQNQATNDHLRVLNGRVTRNEIAIDSLEQTRDVQSGGMKVWSVVSGGIGAVISMAFAYWIEKNH